MITFGKNSFGDLNSLCWKGICDDYYVGKKICQVYGKQMIMSLMMFGVYRRVVKLMIYVIKLSSISTQVNCKRIQENVFQNFKTKDDTNIMQIDFVTAYSCDYQNEIQSALWTRATINYSVGKSRGVLSLDLDNYNHGHNILRLFDVLLNFLFFKSETKRDY